MLYWNPWYTEPCYKGSLLYLAAEWKMFTAIFFVFWHSWDRVNPLRPSDTYMCQLDMPFLAATKQLYKWYFPSVHLSLCHTFLAATKQLYKWYFPSVRLSVCPSVCLSHLFDYVPIIVSSWNFQELLPMTKVRSMQNVKVRGQRSRSQRSRPNLIVSGLYLQFEFTYDDEMMHIAWRCLEEVPYCFLRSSVKF